jgi:general secretion pathway protein C
MKTVLNILSRYMGASQSSLALTFVLSSVAIYQVAVATWLAVPVDEPASAWQPKRVSVSVSTKDANSELATLSQLNLFGEAAQADQNLRKKTVVAARETRLDLTLTGVVASSDANKAMAIIESKGEQDTYGIDDKITGTQAVIEAVYPERVVLRHRGVLENLFLEADGKVSAAAKVSSKKRPTSKRPPTRPPTKDDDSSDEPNVQAILDDPGKLTDYIKISPVRKDGELQGYRVKPGKDAELFESVGLKSNDLAVALNGYDLRDDTQAMQVMTELNQLESINVTVERDGQLVDLYLDIPTKNDGDEAP